MEGWNAKLRQVNRRGGACVLLQRPTLQEVSWAGGLSSPVSCQVEGRGGSSLWHAQSHLLREEGHQTGILGCYLHQEWRLEDKFLMSLSVFGQHQ